MARLDQVLQILTATDPEVLWTAVYDDRREGYTVFADGHWSFSDPSDADTWKEFVTAREAYFYPVPTDGDEPPHVVGLDTPKVIVFNWKASGQSITFPIARYRSASGFGRVGLGAGVAFGASSTPAADAPVTVTIERPPQMSARPIWTRRQDFTAADAVRLDAGGDAVSVVTDSRFLVRHDPVWKIGQVFVFEGDMYSVRSIAQRFGRGRYLELLARRSESS